MAGLAGGEVMRKDRMAEAGVGRVGKRVEQDGLPRGIASGEQCVTAWSRLTAAEAGP